MTEETSPITLEPGPTASRDEVISMMKTIIDPELYIDIWTLGLIYDIDIVDDVLNIRMTFTSVACPAGPQLVGEIKEKAKGWKLKSQK